MKKAQLMKHRTLKLTLLASLGGCLPLAQAAGQSQADAVRVVVVSGSRDEHTSFDLPAAVSVLDASQIQDTQLRVNASEALAAVPGIVVQNRQNYAQDLQISARGFGARSAFGVRGVRLITDGIPATMPDGQGQAASFNLDMAERIEVLRGPFSALYGNHAGGVIQLFTRDPGGAPAIGMSVAAGSDGVRKTDLNAQGKAGQVGYLLDASRFETDGYRAHSAATRDQGYAKLVTRPGEGRLTLVANYLRQHDTQDPLGATWQTFRRDPRAGEPDPADPAGRSLAERYDTRKSIDHQQAGLAYEQQAGGGTLHATVYGGNRSVIQYQSFSKAFQSSPSHSGGVIDFDRDFYGAELRWSGRAEVAQGSLRTTLGLEYARSSDDRRGYENFIGTQFGVKGRMRRAETDDVASLDPYAQAEWQRGRWSLTAGVRHSRVTVDVQDRFLDNGNDSGGIRYVRTTPLASVLYKVTPVLNLYASAARGFETPTLNELFYSGAGAGFNFSLKPATSVHLETGVKALLPRDTRLDAALFQVRTHDELVVDAASGGRTSYRNAGKTLRQGLELSVDSRFAPAWHARLAATLLRAIYDEGFAAIPAGARLPGVARASAYGELGWTEPAGTLGAALEAAASGKAYPDDANNAQPAPGYLVVNARVQARQQWQRWELRQFARLNNLFDCTYVGSLIVGESNRRYYEAAPGRNWALGFSARYRF
jgi:iron complex outermembrane receptor protein